jgi:hypothetical protein
MDERKQGSSPTGAAPRRAVRAATAIGAALALLVPAQYGRSRLASDELPGEVWAGTAERPSRGEARPAQPLDEVEYAPLGEAETLAALARIRDARAHVYPCEARIRVAFLESAIGDDGGAQVFRVEAASATRWRLAHESDDGSFVAGDGAARLLSCVGWTEGGFAVTPSGTNDGGPLALPSWMLEPEYVMGIDPSGRRLRFEIAGSAGELLAASFVVALETGIVEELRAVLLPGDAAGSHPLHVRQTLLERAPACVAEESLAALSDGEVRFESLEARAEARLGPPMRAWR